MNSTKYTVGIDEAGRGPLAGPVAVGVVMVPADFDWNLIPGVNDSKKLSAKKREAIFCRAKELQKEGKLSYVVSFVNASVIDRIGVSKAVRLGIKRGLRRIQGPTLKISRSDLEMLSWYENVHIKLDGLLKAPSEFIYQETITKGDAKEKIIGLASIMAKVTRDRCMVRLAKRHPEYGFEIHMGYGTKAHREAVQKNGLSAVHRRTFCRNVLVDKDFAV